MILNQKETTVAYRCPSCSSTVLSMVGAFTLSGDLFLLKCPCGESSLSISKQRDGKMRITVPCFICPKPHTYVVSEEMFFSRDVFMLSCAYSGIDICFTGTKDAVSAAIKRSDEELCKLLGDTGIDELSRASAQTFTDPQILDIVTFVIRELCDEGKIKCHCTEDDGGKMADGCEKYFIDIDDDGVSVICKKCGASAKIPTDSTLSAYAFLHADSLHLD